MKNKFIDSKIESLNLGSSINNKLNTNNVFLVNDLWNIKRKDLKVYGLSDSEINTIIIKLQLHGIDLGKKSY